MKRLNVEETVAVLDRGGVVAVPTDTVWGLAASVLSREGVEKLYRVKRRERTKPTAILVSDSDMAGCYGVMNKRAGELARRYWPGALTLVVGARRNKVPGLVRGGGKSVGLRVAAHDELLEVIGRLGEGLVTASANFAGERAAVFGRELDERLVEEIDGVMEGEAGGAAASSVVRVDGGRVEVLRQGGVEVC